jgi:histone H3/H4
MLFVVEVAVESIAEETIELARECGREPVEGKDI